MDLSRYADMDPHLLYGILNMKLRNDYADLDDLCRSLDLERSELVRVMDSAGYVYQDGLRQFRPRH